jgi:hypothetical protein
MIINQPPGCRAVNQRRHLHGFRRRLGQAGAVRQIRGR